MRYLALSVGFVGVLFLGVAYWSASRSSLSPGELVRRCEASQPAWNGYQEDIKEIGAGPVAQWQGQPVSLRIRETTVYLTVVLEGPWAQWEAAIPLLMKTPEGRAFRNARYHHGPGGCVYEFDALTTDAVTLPPWLDIQYPHTRKRLHLDGEGKWQAPAVSPDAR